MKECLVIVGSTSHVLTHFVPTCNYDYYVICDRNPRLQTWMSNETFKFAYDLTDETSNQRLKYLLKDIDANLNIVYSSYSGQFSFNMSAEEQLAALNSNCRMPLELFNILSEELTHSFLNGIFISSMYAGISPNHQNYSIRQNQNPLFYGVAKAGVEQGLRWLSCQNKKHRFNSIRLGPMPKRSVEIDDPALIYNLKNNLPSGQFVGHNELSKTLNYMLNSDLYSLRGSIITIDGGYSIW